MNTTKSNAKFKVHVGCTALGRNRWRYFRTLADAREFCDEVQRERNVFLCIETVGGLEAYVVLPKGL